MYSLLAPEVIAFAVHAEFTVNLPNYTKILPNPDMATLWISISLNSLQGVWTHANV